MNALSHCSHPLSETELLVRLRAGEANAYELFFRTHADSALAVARRFFNQLDDAAEAVQDAFISAFRSIQSFQEASRLRTWLHRITVNCCLQKLRRRKRNRFVSLSDLDFPADCRRADSLERAEQCRQVRVAVNQLPDSYREVIQLRDFDGFDTSETASRLGTSEGVVKTRLHRARQALKEILEPML